MGGLTAQYFRELKDRARDAYEFQDVDDALEVCKELAAYEVFIGQSPGAVFPSGEPIKLKIKYPSICQKCGVGIPQNTEVLWVRNKGCWHMGCWG